jgi:hypothetical protein
MVSVNEELKAAKAAKAAINSLSPTYGDSEAVLPDRDVRVLIEASRSAGECLAAASRRAEADPQRLVDRYILDSGPEHAE